MANPNSLKNDANSHYGRVVAFAILGVLAGLVLVTVVPQTTEAPTQSAGTAPTEQPIEVAAPIRLRIPSVGIDTAFSEALGVNPDQTVEVPDSYETVGWYEHGPRPGELGPAVVLGHVDSYEGPAVFFRLGQTDVGDMVEIERSDGSVAVFEITELVQREQSNFPTEAVYGDIDHAGLRLITCSGTYDRGKQVYSHNLIVFAELIEDTASTTGTYQERAGETNL